jgi:hypothetical protein
MAGTIIAAVILLGVFGGGVALIIWFLVAFCRAVLGPSPSVRTTRHYVDPDADADGMNPGDYYNGPHGYSPMTGYPETQYGSGFDPDADWNRERE